MKDRIYLALAFIGFIVIAIVTVKNYDISQDDKEFGVDTYYIPQEVKSRTDSSVELYQQMVGNRKLTCPQPDMIKTTSPTHNLATLYGNSFENEYAAKTIFVTMDTTGSTTANLSDKSTVLGDAGVVQVDTARTASSFRLGDLWSIEDGAYVELIAPFNFLFGNVNTTDGSTIVIINNRNNCKITFTNVANWYCAGAVGTTQVTTNGTGDGATSWEDHVNNHHTIIGATSNAKVSGGSAKDVIGYATSETIVTIERYKDNAWGTISFLDFMTTERRK